MKHPHDLHFFEDDTQVSTMRSTLLTFASLLFVQLLPGSYAGNPFSTNVVYLNSRNFRREVVDYPHAIFVQICRESDENHCQRHQGEWEKLASAVKGLIKIAYWDTDEQGPPPTWLGEFENTPTLRLLKPKKNQTPGSYSEKDVMDYLWPLEKYSERMQRWLENHMTNFSEKVVRGQKDLDAFEAKAEKYGLPTAMVFTNKAETMPLTKFLSTEFRRRLLIAEIKPTDKNKEILDKYGVTDLPALIVIPPSGEGEDPPEPVRYDGDGFTGHKLERFLSKYALQDIVKKIPEAEEKEPKAEF
jgi:hypothetical protein